MQLPVLEAMLGNEVVQQLIKYWPDKCFSAHGPLNRLPALFSEKILSSIPALTEAYQGHLFEFDPGTQGKNMYRVTEDTPKDMLNRGVTAFLSDVSPLLSNAKVFINDLEQELQIKSGSTTLSAFISAAGSGAPTHYDANEVISIQLVGNKKFYISPLQQIRYPYSRQYHEGGLPFTTLYPQISQGYPSCVNQSFEQTDMQPGSVLFMPRGTWHFTEAEQDSMAMSIVLNPPTQVDFFLSQLKITLLQSSAWRSPRYGLGNETGADSKLYNKVSNTIYKLTKNYQHPDSPLRVFHKNSRYLRTPGIEAQVTPGEDFYQVEYPELKGEQITGTVKLQVSSEEAAVFHWFMRQDGPFTVGQYMKNFPAISATESQKLFARAEKTGLLKKLWFTEL